MSEWPTPGLKKLGTAALLGIVVLTWWLVIDNRKLKHETAELFREREYPLLLTGMKIPALDRLAGAGPGSAPAESRRRLIMVSRDSCPFCRENVLQWERLAGEIDAGADLEVWLLTFGGTELLEPMFAAMRRRGLPVRLFAVEDPAILGLKTGINGVPKTFVLDGESRVELVATGVLDDRQVEIFSDYLKNTGS